MLVVVTPGRATSEGGVVEEIVPLGDAGTVQLTIAPAKAGFNQIHLYLFDPDGRPADIAESVTLAAQPAGGRPRAASPARPSRAGPAHFQLDGNDLAVGGTWTIEVQARVDRFTEATGTDRGAHRRLMRPSAPASAPGRGMIGAMARLARLVALALGLVLVTAAPAAADAGRAERLPLRGDRHRARRRRACRPRSAAATPSSSSPSTTGTR